MRLRRALHIWITSSIRLSMMSSGSGRCTRECFHDGGANEVNDVAYVIGTNTGQVRSLQWNQQREIASLPSNLSQCCNTAVFSKRSQLQDSNHRAACLNETVGGRP